MAILGASNDNINIDGATSEYIDFGGLDTYTLLNSLSGDVVLVDNQVSIINLPAGLTVTDAQFLSDGVQFTINGNTVTLLGEPAFFTFIFGGTPLDSSVGTSLSFEQTATALGTIVPAPGAGPNSATTVGEVRSDGSIEVDTTPPVEPPGNTYISGLGGNGVFSDFNIELVFESAFSTAERGAFEMAADYLSSLVVGDLPDQGPIDDIRITALLEPIDGPFGTLGFAGPTALRFTSNFLPSEGQMTFDTADTARQVTEGTLASTVLHEMFHALGFGTFTGFSNNVSAGADARFTGANAIAAYNAEFPGLAGADVLSDFGVPIDGGHWPEDVFTNEILTPTLNDANDFVSGLTVATLEDLGYDTIFDINLPGATVPQLSDFMFA